MKDILNKYKTGWYAVWWHTGYWNFIADAFVHG